jgi:A/G-specific adenine glycosylase
MNLSRMHRVLLDWYVSEKRDLPWRKSKDPYKIWISEIMLQQTRVETVIPYYERFLSHFPTIQDLASAEEDMLLNLWAGLGYYSRARNLQIAAKQIANDFGGKMPANKTQLLTLKGIGDYTASAISSIAFGKSEIALDGNLERVISRLIENFDNPKKEGRAKLLAFGSQLTALGSAGEINQALMDLSRKFCAPKNPKCSECVLLTFCKSSKNGTVDKIPLKAKKAEKILLDAEGWVFLHKNKILLARRKKSDWLSGMWDIPWRIVVKDSIQLQAKKWQLIGSHEQFRTITKHKITFSVKGFQVENLKQLKEENLPGSEFRWVPLEELHGVNLPRPSEKALEVILEKHYRDLN